MERKLRDPLVLRHLLLRGRYGFHQHPTFAVDFPTADGSSRLSACFKANRLNCLPATIFIWITRTPLFAICYLPVPGHPWHFEVLGVTWIVRQMVGVAEIRGGSFATYASTWTGIAEGHAEGDAIEMGMKYRERNRLFFHFSTHTYPGRFHYPTTTLMASKDIDSRDSRLLAVGCIKVY